MNKLYHLNGKLSGKCIHLPFILSLLTFFVFTINSQAQVMNGYAKVTTIATVSGKSQLALANALQTGHTFAVGEQVLVMQMQDNVINGTSNNASFGGALASLASAGYYEEATIDAIAGSPINSMTLHTVLTKSFNISNNSSVQVVSYTKLTTNYTTSANITAAPWSGSLGRGGVIAIQVPGTLTLKHSITADGAGFAGGAGSNNSLSTCSPTVYISNSSNYGIKGEGIYKINTGTNPTYVRGRARVLSGGGGGTMYAAGGGGGSNFTAGGDGASSFLCNSGANESYGLGGLALNTYLMTGARVFLGGGGGGGQGNNGNQSDGANGGGIIILKAGSITTNCGSSVRISANGDAASSVGGFGATAGAGGGGAAGSILLQVGSYSVPPACPLNIQANGGDGGNTGSAVDYGAGGGGGQGAVLFTGAAPSTNVSSVTQPGSGGSVGWSGGTANNGSGANNVGVIGGIGVVLPVRLIYFAAENKNNKAVLNWTSADESNVTYIVERSTDGTNFTSIGTVQGTGKTNYTFTDPNPVNGRVYYQLVITGDLAAKTTYSSIVNVSLSEVLHTAVAYPNPAHDHFYIRVQGESSNKVHKVTVTDLTGQVVYTTTGKPTNNIITVTPGIILTPGLYMFKVTSDGNEQTGKLMIR